MGTSGRFRASYALGAKRDADTERNEAEEWKEPGKEGQREAEERRQHHEDAEEYEHAFAGHAPSIPYLPV